MEQENSQQSPRSTAQNPAQNPGRTGKRRYGRALLGLLLILVTGGIGYATLDLGTSDGESVVDVSDMTTFTVTRAPFEQTVMELGEIESVHNVEVACDVRTEWFDGVEILWVADEGTYVEEGEVIVELDSAKIRERRDEEVIDVLGKKSDVQNAEAVLIQAEVAREEYLRGTFKTEERLIMSELAVAEQDVRKAKQVVRSSEQLQRRGLINQLQLEGVKFEQTNAEMRRDAAKLRLSTLREHTRQKMLVQFDSDIKAAEAELSATKGRLLRNERWLARLEEQVSNCTIRAPRAGVVVYANKRSRRGGYSEFVVEPGAAVRRAQTIIRLPDPTNMQVHCNIKEYRVNLLNPGMTATITLEAFPDRELTGRITKINPYADPESRWSTSTSKKYGTYIELDSPPQDLRTGLSAKAEIFVNRSEDAIQIPLSGLYEYDGDMYSLVRHGPNDFETVLVEVEGTNDEMASISSGIAENDDVVLNLRQYRELMDLPATDWSGAGDRDDPRESPRLTRTRRSAPPSSQS